MWFRVLFIHIIHYIVMRLYNVIKECFFVESNFLCLKPHSVDDDDDDARDDDARDETRPLAAGRTDAKPYRRIASFRRSVRRSRYRVPCASLHLRLRFSGALVNDHD